MNLRVNLQGQRQALNYFLDQISIYPRLWAVLTHLLQSAHFPLYIEVWLEPKRGQDK